MDYSYEIKLIQEGKPNIALQLLEMRRAMYGNDPALHLNIACAHDDLGHKSTAEDIYKLIIQTWPGYDAAYVNLADLLLTQHRVGAAREIANLGVVRCKSPVLLVARGMVYIEELRFGEAMQDFNEAVQQTNDPIAHSTLLGFTLHLGYKKDLHTKWAKRCVDMTNAVGHHWDGKRRIRVGITGDVFRHCAVANMLLPFVEALPSILFDTYIYSDVPRNNHDTITEMFMNAQSVKFWNTGTWADNGLIQEIRKDCIDVLIDPQGHKLGSRIMVHAAHPAPVQYTYVGYAGNTYVGENIDRVIGWAYRPICSHTMTPSEAPWKENGFVTFGSVNRAAKVSVQSMALWGHILRNNPTAKMIQVIKGGESNLMARCMMVRCGIPNDQLQLIDRPEKHVDYLRLADKFDVMLDTFPYGGGTTTADMAFMGVKTITMPRDMFAMGDHLSPLVVSREGDYVALAEQLARNPQSIPPRVSEVVGDDRDEVVSRFRRLCLSALHISPDSPCCDNH